MDDETSIQVVVQDITEVVEVTNVTTPVEVRETNFFPKITIDNQLVQIIADKHAVEVKNFSTSKVEIKEVDGETKIVRETPTKIEFTNTQIAQARAVYAGTPGRRGEKGERGDDASSFKTVTWVAPAASTVWYIEHDLGCFPSVTVIDSAGTQFWADVTYIDLNTLRVNFAYATMGTAYLN